MAKHRFEIKQPARHEQILDYLRRTPSVRDVVVSGGDVANLPIRVLEQFVSALLDIDNIRDIRLASKGLMGLPSTSSRTTSWPGWSAWPSRRTPAGSTWPCTPT